MKNFLAFNSYKFAMYFTPITLFVFLMLICIILILYTRKNRKIAERIVQYSQKNSNFDENLVKTVYTNKEENFSQTENLPVPENFSTQEFDFEFAGWDKYFVDENGQLVTQAIWIRKPKEYTVKVFGRNTKEPIAVKKVNYGAGVDLMDLMPEKEEDENFVYTFIGWDKVPTSVECDTAIFAKFETRTKDGGVVVLNDNDEESVEQETDNDLTTLEENQETEQNVTLQSNEEENFASNQYEEEYVENFEKEDLQEKSDNSEAVVFNNIKVGKPAITHGVDTTVRSKNGYKIEKSNSIYNAYSINVDNKSTNAESDDIFKRAGVGIRGYSSVEQTTEKPEKTTLNTPNNSEPLKGNRYSIYKNQAEEDTKPADEEDDETEQFFKNTMLVNHRKTIKK